MAGSQRIESDWQLVIGRVKHDDVTDALRWNLINQVTIETALADAVDVGDGFAFVRLRRCLDDARLANSSPAVAFGQLGTDLGVDELVELASSLALAGSEGAKVRSSIQAKAASMRVHELSAAEEEAQAATERMSLPMVFLLIGFFLMIGFPAFSRIGGGL